MHISLPLLFLLIFSVPYLYAADRDVQGSRDHELISRYESSVIIGYEFSDFDAFRLPLGAVKRNRNKIVMDDHLDLEGRLTLIAYEHSDKTSTLKVFRNFQQALNSAGFETMFKCTGDDCGQQDIWDEALNQPMLTNAKQRTIRYMAATKTDGEEGIYIGLYVMEKSSGNVLVGLNVLESEVMESGLVSVDAKTLDRLLEKDGKVAVYGIYFDRDKSDLRQESYATLDQIEKLLTMKKDLNLYIVGHTDDTGSVDHNLNLSKRRAEAVVQALVRTHSISADRLVSFGAGPYVPVASNLNKEGQAKNRRVELVRRLE